MQISFVIPTRDRTPELEYSLHELGQIPAKNLGDHPELILIDNASKTPICCPDALPNGIRVVCIRLESNMGAGARNIGVEHAQGDWVIMLDDDSHLRKDSDLSCLDLLDKGVAALGGEIWLPDRSHEAGGLTEVVVGCGCAIRRNAYLAVGGYDNSFGYYAEEYDLCAKLIAAGYEVRHSKQLQFEHRKSSFGRDMNEILFRLVRNNGWVIQRYSPEHCREQSLESMKRRYKKVAAIENAVEGYERGLSELDETILDERKSTLSEKQWARFTGSQVVEQGLDELKRKSDFHSIQIVGKPNGKGLETILQIVDKLGFNLISSDVRFVKQTTIQVVGTLSPGPIADTLVEYPDAIFFGGLINESTFTENSCHRTPNTPLQVH
ncbi:MAG: glycosyltransferase [Phycisphaerales bacterium]|nr:glycosyltransferase [Phycisphaerales bacterium]